MGVTQTFAKIQGGMWWGGVGWGGQGYLDKIGRGIPILGFNFYCIFMNKFFENLPEGGCAVSSIPLPSVCIYGVSPFGEKTPL
jgi:hypothetical protein